MLPSLTQEEVFRYARHLTIPEVGMEGQRKLKSASVLIIGTGGLGSPISLYLAAAGVGRIGLVDFDVVDTSDLQRQVIHDTSQIGRLKVESARQRMLSINPLVQVDIFPEAFTVENAMRLSAAYDLILDGSDNFAARYLINDLCVLTGKPYIYGSIFQFEGQVSVFDARVGPCYRCIFSEPPPEFTVPHGVHAGVFGVLPGTIGTIEASEALKWIMGIGSSLTGHLLLYDTLEMVFHKIQIRKNPACKVCGTQPEITTLEDRYRAYQWKPAEIFPPEVQVSPEVLKQMLHQGQPILLLDVRNPVELEISCLPIATNIPLSSLPGRLKDLPRDKDIVTISRAGVRAGQALRLLLDAGFTRVRLLSGGMNAWADKLDPGLFQY